MDGLPVEWISAAVVENALLRFRLQSVGYACRLLFTDALDRFHGCSILFIQGLMWGGLSVILSTRQDR